MTLKLSFGDYELQINTGDTLMWLVCKNGEGMEVSELEMEKILKDYYEGNF